MKPADRVRRRDVALMVLLAAAAIAVCVWEGLQGLNPNH